MKNCTKSIVIVIMLLSTYCIVSAWSSGRLQGMLRLMQFALRDSAPCSYSLLMMCLYIMIIAASMSILLGIKSSNTKAYRRSRKKHN